MFETLAPAQPDKILALISMFREDPRPEKYDLGVGVYKDPAGATPVMAAVKAAERRVLASQTSKTYLGPEGDPRFNAAISRLAFGNAFDGTRLRAIQAPGGSGALRIIAELLADARPGCAVHLPDPTWPNHRPVAEAAGLKVRTYPYFDPVNGEVRFEEMLEAIRELPAGDIVLLHGCCHNPTGANLDARQWSRLAGALADNDLFPFVDMAYQGFGDGLDEDAAGLRHLASEVPELAAAVSCSKNFAVYCDRVGAAILVAANGRDAETAIGRLKTVARRNYSMPPNHGAATVRTVLEDAALSTQWRQELDGMRTRMLRLRVDLADALRRQSNSDRFDFLAMHRGMFSLLGLSDDQVRELREDFAIYMVGGGRINVAGLRDEGLDKLAAAIVEVSSR